MRLKKVSRRRKVANAWTIVRHVQLQLAACRCFTSRQARIDSANAAKAVEDLAGRPGNITWASRERLSHRVGRSSGLCHPIATWLNMGCHMAFRFARREGMHGLIIETRYDRSTNRSQARIIGDVLEARQGFELKPCEEAKKPYVPMS